MQLYIRQAAAVCFVLATTCGIAEDEPQYDVTAADSAGLPRLLMLKAKEFALANPKSASAPRAGLDWYITAVATSNESEKNAATIYLLLEHPNSLPATFVFRSFKDGGELAKCLVREFERENHHLTRDFLHKYITTLGAAPGELQGAALRESDFLVSLVFAHEQTLVLPESRRNGLRKLLGDKNVRLFDLIVNKDLSTAEKLVRAEEFNDSSIGRTVQRGWFVQLWQNEQIGPQEHRVYVENLLYGQQWAQALPWIEKIPAESRDSQVSFWLGWTLATLGRTGEAKEELDRLAASPNQDEWTASAAQLAKALEHHKELNDEFTNRLKALQTEWKKKLPEVVEVRFKFDSDSKKQDGTKPISFDGYVGIDTARDRIELLLRKDSQPIIAYRSKGPACSLMIVGNPSIMTYAKGAVVPLFSVKIVEAAPDKLNMNFNFNTKSYQAGLLAESLKALLSPVLESDEGWVSRMMTHVNRQGNFLLPKQADHAEEFVWLVPHVEKPQCDEYGLRLNDQGFGSLDDDKVAVRMGSANEVELSPPSWPDLPVVEEQELQFAQLMEVFTTLGKLFADDEKNKEKN